MACLRVTVRQPSGASFEVDLVKSGSGTLQRLKAQIATRTKIATARQKLLVGHELLSEQMLEAETEGLEVLLISCRSCSLVSPIYAAPAVWDAEAKTLLKPAVVQDGLLFQHTCDAMYLDDGEVYVLLVAARENPDEHWLDLWRGVPGSSVRHFPLPSEWLDGGRGDAQLTPDGEFVVAWGGMGETLLWRVTGGTAHVTADGSDWPGCPRAMSVDYAIFDGGRGRLQVWDYHQGVPKHTLEFPFAGFSGIDILISHSGAYVALWACGKALEIFAHNGERVGDVSPAFGFHVKNMAFSPDESEIALQYREDPLKLRVIRNFIATDRQELIVVLHSDFPHYFIKVDYSADGQTLAVLQASGALHRFKRQSWDSLDDSWEELPYMPKPSGEDVMRSGVCQDYNTYFRYTRDGSVGLMDLESGHLQIYLPMSTRTGLTDDGYAREA